MVLRHDRKRIPLLLDFVRYPHNPAVQAEAVRISSHLSGERVMTSMRALLFSLAPGTTRQCCQRNIDSLIRLLNSRQLLMPFCLRAWRLPELVLAAKHSSQPRFTCSASAHLAERIPNLVPLLLNSPPTGNVPAVHRLQASKQSRLHSIHLHLWCCFTSLCMHRRCSGLAHMLTTRHAGPLLAYIHSVVAYKLCGLLPSSAGRLCKLLAGLFVQPGSLRGA